MGDLDVMHGWLSEEARASLPLFQEVLAVCESAQVVPVGRVGDQSLEMSFRVISGPSEGRLFRQYVPVHSRDMTTEGNGRAILGILYRSLGITWPSDSSELLGKPVVLRLSRKRGEEDRPHANYGRCSNADLRVWEEWLARQTQGDAQAAETTPGCRGDRQDVAFE